MRRISEMPSVRLAIVCSMLLCTFPVVARADQDFPVGTVDDELATDQGGNQDEWEGPEPDGGEGA